MGGGHFRPKNFGLSKQISLSARSPLRTTIAPNWLPATTRLHYFRVASWSPLARQGPRWRDRVRENRVAKEFQRTWATGDVELATEDVLPFGSDAYPSSDFSVIHRFGSPFHGQTL